MHAALAKWLAPEPQAAPQPAASGASSGETRANNELLLDRATLNALRALPRSGQKDMLSHIAELYLSDSGTLVASIEHALDVGEAANLARAAHAWRSYNGNVGAHSLARLCRELEDNARAGNLTAAREVFGQIRVLHERVRDELQYEMRRSA